jgi:flagellar biosynthesis/type III secretory pathway protein FliH
MNAPLPAMSGLMQDEQAPHAIDAIDAGLHWLDHDVLRHSSARVVRRAEVQQALAARRMQADLQQRQREAQAQLDQWRAAAEQAGHAAGHAAGLLAGQAQWARQLAERQLQRQQQLDALGPTLVSVVMQALQHLVQALPEPQRFELLATRLMAQAVLARRLRLVVSPADAAQAEAALARWQQAGSAPAAAEVLVDPALAAGDCVLETEEAAVDGRLDERLAAIEAALHSQIGQAAQAR